MINDKQFIAAFYKAVTRLNCVKIYIIIDMIYLHDKKIKMKIKIKNKLSLKLFLAKYQNIAI